jgi:hypothetical protein
MVNRGIRCCLAGAFLFTGCGLSNYEQDMYRQQQRIENIDRENQVLGLPLAAPPKLTPEGKRGEGPVTEVFIRPPLGIMPNFDENPFGLLLWRYGDKGGLGLIEMYLGAATGVDRDHFWQDVLFRFPNIDLKEVKNEIKTPVGRAPLEFETLAFTLPGEQPRSYYIYVYRGQTAGGEVVRVAVIYVMPQTMATDNQLQAAIDASLKTLAVGAEAAKLLREYRPTGAALRQGS